MPELIHSIISELELEGTKSLTFLLSIEQNSCSELAKGTYGFDLILTLIFSLIKLEQPSKEFDSAK